MKSLARSIAVLGLLGSTSGWAHTHLVRSTPADGATLAITPQEAVLVFAEPVTIATATIESPDGSKSTVVPPAGTLAEVHLNLPSLTPGHYRMTWRAASADGHIMKGQIAFTVGGAPKP